MILFAEKADENNLLRFLEKRFRTPNSLSTKTEWANGLIQVGVL